MYRCPASEEPLRSSAAGAQVSIPRLHFRKKSNGSEVCDFSSMRPKTPGLPDGRKLSKAFPECFYLVAFAPKRGAEACPAGSVDTSPASFCKVRTHTLGVCSHFSLFLEYRRMHRRLGGVYGLNKDSAMEMES